jgi:hypothetical protein
MKTLMEQIAAAVQAQGGFTRDEWQDIHNHGIGGGFSGFISYCDTNTFFGTHKEIILQLANEIREELGISTRGEVLAGFHCLKGYTAEECTQALYTETDDTHIIKNALAWFAAEEAARYICEQEEEEEEEEPLTEYEALKLFDEMLDECYEPINAFGLTLYAADTLKTCDPIAYRETFNNWLDSEGLEIQ